MQQQYDNRNKGSLWHNKKKQQNPKAPDYTGTLDVNGQKFRISVWGNQPKSHNDPVMKFTIQDANEAQRPQQGYAPAPQGNYAPPQQGYNQAPQYGHNPHAGQGQYQQAPVNNFISDEIPF